MSLAPTKMIVIIVKKKIQTSQSIVSHVAEQKCVEPALTKCCGDNFVYMRQPTIYQRRVAAMGQGQKLKRTPAVCSSAPAWQRL